MAVEQDGGSGILYPCDKTRGFVVLLGILLIPQGAYDWWGCVLRARTTTSRPSEGRRHLNLLFSTVRQHHAALTKGTNDVPRVFLAIGASSMRLRAWLSSSSETEA